MVNARPRRTSSCSRRRRAAGWRGLGAFVVKKGTPGLRVLDRETTLGLDAASFGGIKLDGVEVDESDRLAGGDDFTTQRSSASSRSTRSSWRRVAWGSREPRSTSRASTARRGAPSANRSATSRPWPSRSRIARMDVDAARALVWRAAHLVGREARRERSPAPRHVARDRLRARSGHALRRRRGPASRRRRASCATTSSRS